MQKIPVNNLNIRRNQNVCSLNSSPRQMHNTGWAPQSSMLVFRNSLQADYSNNFLRDQKKCVIKNDKEDKQQRKSLNKYTNVSIIGQRSSSLKFKHIKNGSSHVNNELRLLESYYEKENPYQMESHIDYQIGSSSKQNICFDRKKSKNIATLKKVTSKISMKHFQSQPPRQYQQRQQKIIADLNHVPLSQSIQSSCVQDRTYTQIRQVIKQFQRQVQTQKNKLVTQIQKQSSTIGRLSQSLSALERQISLRERKIVELQKMVEQERSLSEEKMKNLEAYLNHIALEIYPKNAEIQLNLNSKISLLEDKLLQYRQSNAGEDILQKIKISMGTLFNKLSQQINTGWQADLHRIKCHLLCLSAPGAHQFMKQSDSTESSAFSQITLSETAKFQSQVLQNPENCILDDSQTYFFHPCELENYQKISQLLKFRNQVPIRCLVDAQNRLKYCESGAFVFDKKGNPLKLTQSQIKYYSDCGYLSYPSEETKL